MVPLNRIAQIASIGIFCAMPAAQDDTARAQATSANQPNQVANPNPANPLMQGPFSPTDTAATPVFRIRYLGSGWTLDQMLVFPDQPLPLTNPGGCGNNPDSYITQPADPGHSLFHTILLSAFLNGRQVQMVISGCWLDHPRLIGVDIH
jgi:hypothetical protein